MTNIRPIKELRNDPNYIDGSIDNQNRPNTPDKHEVFRTSQAKLKTIKARDLTLLTDQAIREPARIIYMLEFFRDKGYFPGYVSTNTSKEVQDGNARVTAAQLIDATVMCMVSPNKDWYWAGKKPNRLLQILITQEELNTLPNPIAQHITQEKLIEINHFIETLKQL